MGLGIFGYGGQPGYYLHSFAPALAPVIGIAITTVARNGLARTVFWLLMGYNIAFLLGATLMQFLYFAGCGSIGTDRFNVAAASSCWNDWQRLIDNLDILAYPLAALLLVAGGAAALGWGALASLVLRSSHTNGSKLVAVPPRKALSQSAHALARKAVRRCSSVHSALYGQTVPRSSAGQNTLLLLSRAGSSPASLKISPTSTRGRRTEVLAGRKHPGHLHHRSGSESDEGAARLNATWSNLV
jgi:hypothetical protein